MRSKLRNIGNKVLKLGVGDGQDTDQSLKVKILNGLSLIILVFVLFNSFWGVITREVTIVFANYFTATFMLLVLFFNSRLKYTLARLIFFLSLAIHIGFVELYLDVGAHFFLFPLFIAAAFLIESKAYLSLYFFLLLLVFILAESRSQLGISHEIDPVIKRMITIVDGIVAFGFSIISISLFRRQYTRNRDVILAQNQLLKKTAEISKEHAELASVLMSEMNHRVKNNLQLVSSLLNIQANQLEDKTAKHAIQDSIQRISSIALIHRQLYKYANKQSVKINVAEYVRELIPFIKKSVSAEKNGIDIHMNVQNIVLPVEEAVSVGLILNETITNSIKHGLKNQQKKEIDLDIKKNGDNKIRIIVSDNGWGIQQMAAGENLGFGYELIKTLVSNYKGNMIIDKVENKITIEMNCGLHTTTFMQEKEIAAL